MKEVTGAKVEYREEKDGAWLVKEFRSINEAEDFVRLGRKEKKIVDYHVIVLVKEV